MAFGGRFAGQDGKGGSTEGGYCLYWAYTGPAGHLFHWVQRMVPVGETAIWGVLGPFEGDLKPPLLIGADLRAYRVGGGSTSGFTAGVMLLQGIFGFSDGCMMRYGQGHRLEDATDRSTGQGKGASCCCFSGCSAGKGRGNAADSRFVYALLILFSPIFSLLMHAFSASRGPLQDFQLIFHVFSQYSKYL